MERMYEDGYQNESLLIECLVFGLFCLVLGMNLMSRGSSLVRHGFLCGEGG